MPAAVSRTAASALAASSALRSARTRASAVALALLAGRVDAVELDARLGLLAELVDADDDLPARLDGGLEAVGGLLDLALDEAGLDRGHRTAELVDACDQLGRALLEIRRERLDVVRAAERIGRIGGAGLVHQDLLRAQCDRRRVLARECERLVEAVRVERLRAATDGRECLHGNSDDVVLGLLGGEGRAAGLRVEAQRLRLRGRGAEAVAHDLRPQRAGCPELRDLLEEVVVGVEEEREPGAERIGERPAATAASQ